MTLTGRKPLEHVLAATLCASIGLAAASQSSTPRPQETGALAGRVLDDVGLPVVGVTVVPFERESGLPLHAERLVPFVQVLLDESSSDNDALLLAHAVTGSDGRFRLEGLPRGDYRLLAQTWDDAQEPVTKPLESNGKTLTLRGVVRQVAVPSPMAEDLLLTPLGSAVLEIDQKCGNDGTLMMVSTSPTTADPILGLAGWHGAFLSDVIAANRMPDCLTTLRGLPSGTVHVAFFATDNIPGFADASVEVSAGETKKLSVPFVCSWSDARHDPPERLAALVEELAALEEPPPAIAEVYLSIKRDMERDKKSRAIGGLTATIPYLDRMVEMPDGRTVRMADVLAAEAYVRLQRRVGKRD